MSQSLRTFCLSKYFALNGFFSCSCKRGQYYDGKCNLLSNAVFGFALAPEILEVFRNDVRQSQETRNFGHFWPPEWPERKFDWNSFVIFFDGFLNVFFRFSLRPIGVEIDVFFKHLPPPVGGGKSGLAVGRGLTLRCIRTVHPKNIFYFILNECVMLSG